MENGCKAVAVIRITSCGFLEMELGLMVKLKFIRDLILMER